MILALDEEPRVTLGIRVFSCDLVDRFLRYVEVLVDSDAHPDYCSNAD